MMRRSDKRAAGAGAALLALLAPLFGPGAAGAGPATPQSDRTIVIDPGHGGLDVGAKGKFGSLEKDITLSISGKLKALIEQNLAYRVVLTRERDLDVSLENRSAAANNNDAILFISIHTNGSFRKIAQGAETYFLNPNASDEETRKLAYLENTGSALEGRISEEAKDDVTMILWDMAQAAHIRQSARLAEEIQKELNQPPLGIANRGIKQAPFKVLTGVACPAVLVEVAFISSPEEEQNLIKDEFQAQVAQALFRGLVRYLRLFPPK
ncbi:MAG: N-acetylmuramoyl-L-alanine amidase [Candidatus Aminicenantes bacterium]|nr:N-acetylmuramoyl-L-alanine amidase [Candidatus Aminicenantes bacterium]